jgi:hypothetical protein
MPLPPAAVRTPAHTRRQQIDGYRRADGLWDIEGHLTDLKGYTVDNRERGAIPPGEPIHAMAVRLTLDGAYVVRDIAVTVDGAPYAACSGAAPGYRALVGETVGLSWARRVRAVMGRDGACPHLSGLLTAMGPVAWQTIAPVYARAAGAQSADAPGGCHARPRSTG